MVGAEVTELIQGYVVAIEPREPREEELLQHDLPPSDIVGDDEGRPCSTPTGSVLNM